MTINERVITEIKLISPDDLELHGVITPAKSTAKVNGYQTYLCPSKGCTNGTGSTGDGIVVYHNADGYSYHCFSCESHFDNIDLLAEYYGLDSVQDFPEIVKRACEDFSINYDDSSTKNAPRKAPMAQKSVENNSTSKDRELELIHSDISQAKSNLPNFIERCGGSWRGLTLETLQKFGCGYLPNWVSPKTRVNSKKLPSGTARVIIPTDNHYLACMLAKDRTDENKSYWKMHAGTKELFNFNRVTYNILIVVEGEIDAMSIWQATGYDTVATCGVGGYMAFTEAVKGKDNLSVIILFDSDSAGRSNAEKFKQSLLAEGVKVAVAFLDDGVSKLDANDILVNQGQAALKAAIDKIFSDAVFEPAAEDTSERAKTRANNDFDDKIYKTSKEHIESCPVDVEIPPNFLFGKYCIQNHKGKTVVSTPVVVTKVFVPHDNEVAAVEIAFYNRKSDSWQFITVDFATIADNKKILQLATFGVTVVQEYSKFLSIFIMRMIDFGKNVNIIPRVDLYGKPGWHNDKFISPYDTTCTIKTAGVDYHRAFSTSGDKSAWLDTFKKVVVASPVARLILGAALAAPLLKVCNLRSAQIHLACPSGNGKSAIVKFALSIFGNPAELYRTFNSTGNSILEWATKFNDLPHGLDELQAANKREREKVDELIYQLSGQQGRGRLGRDGSLKPVSTFRALRLSTGEQKLTTDASGQGAIRRVLEITYPKIFNPDFAAYIHEFLEDGNFGFYGAHWINFVTSNCDALKREYDALLPYSNAIAHNSLDDHVKLITLCYIALNWFYKSIADDLGDFDFSPIAHFDADLAILLQGVPDKNNSTNINRARDAINDYLFTHSACFSTEHSTGEFTSEKNAREIFGVKFKDGSVGFFKSGLVKILDECGFPSAEAIIRAFIDEGYFQGNTKHPAGMIQRYVDNSRKRAWLYVFNTEYLNCSPDDDE